MSSAFMIIYILLILAFTFGIAGFILFIIGLSQARKSVWMRGLTGILLGIIMGAAIVVTFISRYNRTIARSDHDNYRHYWQERTYRDTEEGTTEDDTFYDSTYTTSISGYLIGEEREPVLIKIFINRLITENGISVERIGQPRDRYGDKRQQFISMYLKFAKDFKGFLELTSFTGTDEKLSSSVIELRQQKGMEAYIDFLMEWEQDTVSPEYCTLNVTGVADL